ncbi:MAG: hypothetical protein R6V75_11485 [Bacteroidales bacterium]
MTSGFQYKEGQRLPFLIANKLALPGTDEINFILVGPDQKKHLLPEQDYALYNLKVGQSITCTVDKINCSGKIFLEPDHPYYKIGERYDFLVLRISEQETFMGASQLIAWVRDLHGLEWPCPVDSIEGIEPGYSHLACRVERIRKAELQLSLPAFTSRFSALKTGQEYLFRVTDIKTFEDKEFYIVKDFLGNYHRLPVDYYKDYGFRMNQEVKALVVKYSPTGECIIEPLHPYYKPGEEYPFRFVRLEKKVDLFGRVEAVLLVEDLYGNLVKVKPEPWQIEDADYKPDQIICKVLKSKKGRPVLINREQKPA